MQRFSKSKYNLSWISVFVIFLGTIVYPITFEYVRKNNKNSRVEPVSFNFPVINIDTIERTSSPVLEKPQTEVKSTNVIFTKDLKIGDKDPQVKKLQEYLNQRGFVVSETGNGSPGNETELFGPGTEKALKEFQETYADILLKPYGLSEGTGFFGSATRNFISS